MTGLALSLLALAVASLSLLLVRAMRLMRAERLARQAAEAELQVVSDLAGVMAGTDWQRSVQSLLEALVGAGACQNALLLAPTEAGNLEVRAAAHAPGGPAWAGVSEAAVHQAMETRSPVTFEADALLLPVVEEGEPAGVLTLRGARPYSPALAVAVRLIALGLTGTRLYQKQTALSNTDGLTGLANHRHFQQSIGIAMGQAYLEGEPLSLILLDIDYFKAVNDTYGHLLGDLVLREMAYVLRRELPPGALAARYGGEEMAVLLQGDAARHAPELAEALRQAIAGHQISDFGTGARIAVTVSLGVAVYELGQGKNRLVARADEALYASKRQGRNRVTVAPPENSTSHLFPS